MSSCSTTCNFCGKKFDRYFNLQRHLTETKNTPCSIMNKNADRSNDYESSSSDDDKIPYIISGNPSLPPVNDNNSISDTDSNADDEIPYLFHRNPPLGTIPSLSNSTEHYQNNRNRNERSRDSCSNSSQSFFQPLAVQYDQNQYSGDEDVHSDSDQHSGNDDVHSDSDSESDRFSIVDSSCSDADDAHENNVYYAESYAQSYLAHITNNQFMDTYNSNDSNSSLAEYSDSSNISSQEHSHDNNSVNSDFSMMNTEHLLEDNSSLSDASQQSDEANENEPIDPVEAKLLMLMTKFSIPLHAYPKFIKWGKECKESSGYNFDRPTSFGSTIKKLTSHKSMQHNKPRIVDVTVEGAPTCTVHAFPFLMNIRKLLSNKDVMSKSVFNYDGRRSYYGEINSGKWWQMAEADLNNRLEYFNISSREHHHVAPIILFIDATHCDRNGRLKAEPVLCSLGNISLQERKKPSAWFFLGLLPSKNLTSAERKKAKQGRGLRSAYIKLYHECLREIFKELIQIQKQDRQTGKGIPCYVAGLGKKYLHFELCFVIGDTVGHDYLCCHYQTYSSSTPKPCRACNIPWDEMDNPEFECTWTNADELYHSIHVCMNNIMNRENVTENREKAQSLSHLLHLPIFHEMFFGASKLGILGATPYEILHMLLLGTLKSSLKCLYSFVEVINTPNGSFKKELFDSSEFERRVRIISQHSKRQSDREMPRMSFNSGVTTLAGIQGQEYVGLSILTIAALPGMLKDRNIEKQFASLLWTGIVLYSKATRDKFPYIELARSESGGDLAFHKCVADYIKQYVTTCGKQREIQSPKTGTKQQKIHGLTHLSKQIELYGSAENFNGSYLESHLKSFIKHPAKRTRKTHSYFSSDLINR